MVTKPSGKGDPQNPLQAQLISLLQQGNAHIDFESALKGFPISQRSTRPADSPHSAWQLLEHLRLAQADILEFSRDGRHKSPKWPEGYWPEREAPPDSRAWGRTVRAFEKDRAAFIELLAKAEDLLQPIPYAPDGQTLLQEVLTLADHNSYHLGQFMLLRRMLELGDKRARTRGIKKSKLETSSEG